MAWIGRQYQRDQLKLAQATRMAGAKQDDWETWQRDIDTVTGVPRHAE